LIGTLKDVLIASGERKLLLYDLNNLTTIPLDETLDIKTTIEDLVVIDGIAYIALGDSGIWAISIGALVDGVKPNAILAKFTSNKLVVVKANSSENIITKSLNSKKLADSKPFLLSAGDGNNLTVIKIAD
jgi:hypothetical protein